MLQCLAVSKKGLSEPLGSGIELWEEGGCWPLLKDLGETDNRASLLLPLLLFRPRASD